MDGIAAAIYRYCWLTFLWLSSAVNSIKFCLILLTRNAIIFQRELSRRGVADDAHRMQSAVENRFDNQSENEILIENNIFELNWNKTVTEYMQQNELFLSGIWVTEEKYYIAEWVFHILFNIIFFFLYTNDDFRVHFWYDLFLTLQHTTSLCVWTEQIVHRQIQKIKLVFLLASSISDLFRCLETWMDKTVTSNIAAFSIV